MEEATEAELGEGSKRHCHAGGGHGDGGQARHRHAAGGHVEVGEEDTNEAMEEAKENIEVGEEAKEAMEVKGEEAKEAMEVKGEEANEAMEVKTESDEEATSWISLCRRLHCRWKELDPTPSPASQSPTSPACPSPDYVPTECADSDGSTDLIVVDYF